MENWEVVTHYQIQLMNFVGNPKQQAIFAAGFSFLGTIMIIVVFTSINNLPETKRRRKKKKTD